MSPDRETKFKWERESEDQSSSTAPVANPSVTTEYRDHEDSARDTVDEMGSPNVRPEFVPTDGVRSCTDDGDAARSGQVASHSSAKLDESRELGFEGREDVAADADTVMRSAFGYLRITFGDKWAERAAMMHRKFLNWQRAVEEATTRVSEANQQVKAKDNDYRKLKSAYNQLKEQHATLDQRTKEVETNLSSARNQIQQMRQSFEDTRCSERDQVVGQVKKAFGSNSDLHLLISGLRPDLTAHLGYACLFSLPAQIPAGREAVSPKPIPALLVLANKFLENLREFDGPERTSLLNLVADHLSRANPQFSFMNEEGKLFNPDRHTAARNDSGTLPDAKVQRMISFYVVNNRTKQVLQKAEVLL